MSRHKKNRYKLKTNVLNIQQSLLLSWCTGKTDKEIIRQILIVNRLFSTLKSYDEGRREIELIKVRVHEEGE